MINALIIIFVLGMAVTFYANNKKEIDKKSDNFKDILDS